MIFIRTLKHHQDRICLLPLLLPVRLSMRQSSRSCCPLLRSLQRLLITKCCALRTAGQSLQGLQLQLPAQVGLAAGWLEVFAEDKDVQAVRGVLNPAQYTLGVPGPVAGGPPRGKGKGCRIVRLQAGVAARLRISGEKVAVVPDLLHHTLHRTLLPTHLLPLLSVFLLRHLCCDVSRSFSVARLASRLRPLVCLAE